MKSKGRECVLNYATLYMAMDDQTTPFDSMGNVTVLIGSENVSTAESGVGTPCTSTTFSSGEPCGAVCANDDTVDHAGDDSWPDSFQEWSDQEGTDYHSCNEFYALDVTGYLQ